MEKKKYKPDSITEEEFKCLGVKMDIYKEPMLLFPNVLTHIKKQSNPVDLIAVYIAVHTISEHYGDRKVTIKRIAKFLKVEEERVKIIIQQFLRMGLMYYENNVLYHLENPKV